MHFWSDTTPVVSPDATGSYTHHCALQRAAPATLTYTLIMAVRARSAARFGTTQSRDEEEERDVEAELDSLHHRVQRLKRVTISWHDLSA